MRNLAQLFGTLAVAAGQPIMEVYARGPTSAVKSDGSPVTEADMRAEEFILDQLARHCPNIPVIAEESMAAGHRAAIAEQFILVDPLDGTKEFIHRRDEFTVNIALIEAGHPVAGAIYAPAFNQLWIGGEDGAFFCNIPPGEHRHDAFQFTAIRTRPWPMKKSMGVASRSHADSETDAFLAQLHVSERHSRGSSLKFCLVAAGEADVYPRFSPTMEWDIAAGHAILLAAGGCVTKPDGSPVHYGKIDQGFLNGPFVAWGDPAYQRAHYR